MAEPVLSPSFAARSPLAAHTAERAVLSSMLSDTQSLTNACEQLLPEDFDDPRHRVLYEELYRLHRVERKAISPEVLMDEIFHKLDDVGGIDYLKDTAEFAPTPAHLNQYIHSLKEKSTLRKMQTVGTEMVRLAHNHDLDVQTKLDRSQALMLDLDKGFKKREYISLVDVVNALWDEVVDYHDAPGELRGVSTGFGLLDYMTGGLRGGDLIILAARPSMGKTAFAINIAQHVARDKPVLVFSLEMSTQQIAMRMLCSEAGIDTQKVNQGKCNEHEWEGLEMAFNRLCQLKMYIDDSPGTTPFDVASKARRLYQKEGSLGLIVVDYLTLLRPTTSFDSMTQQVSEMSRQMKAVARELNVPLLVLSQLNRELEKTKDKRPALSHLRESGAIEQDADIVMFLHRPDYYQQSGTQDDVEEESPQSSVVSDAELIISKHRNGPTGSIHLGFHKSQVKFVPLERPIKEG